MTQRKNTHTHTHTLMDADEQSQRAAGENIYIYNKKIKNCY